MTFLGLGKKTGNSSTHTSRLSSRTSTLDSIKDELARKIALSLHARSLMLHLNIPSDEDYRIDENWSMFKSSYIPGPSSWVVSLELGNDRGRIRAAMEKDSYDQLMLAIPRDLLVDGPPTIEYNKHSLVIEGQWPESVVVNDETIQLREVVTWRDLQTQNGNGGFSFRHRKPLPIGVTRRGKTASLHFDSGVTRGRDAFGNMDLRITHLLIVGTTGSGKSVLVNSIAASAILSMRTTGNRYALFGADWKNSQLGLRSIESKLGFVGPVTSTVEEVTGMMQVLTAIRKCRVSGEVVTNPLHKKFVEGVADREILVFLDEFPGMFEESDEVAAMVDKELSQAREAGIFYILSSQHPNIQSSFAGRSSMRANLDSAIALRVRDSNITRTIFSDDAANLPAHMLPKPGHAYIKMADGTRSRVSTYLIEPRDLEMLPEGSWISETFVSPQGLDDIMELDITGEEAAVALEIYYRRNILGETFGRTSAEKARATTSLGESRFQKLQAFGEEAYSKLVQRGCEIKFGGNNV